MSRGVKIVIGVVVVLVCLCGAGMLFVNWANSDEGQAATATAVMATVNERMQNMTLVHENTFEEGTPIVNKFGEDLEPYYLDGIPRIIVPWNGSTILFNNLNLTDFVAEVDCANNGAYCGIAYNYKDNAMPTGGVICASSRLMTSSTPYQIGSMSR